MLLRRAAAVAVALAGTVVHAPVAHAAEPAITIRTSPAFAQPMEDEVVDGAGIVAGAVCEAVGQGGTATQVAVAIEITCTMNGTTTSASAPGPAVASSVVVATAHPIQVCVWAKAVFLEAEANASDITVVTAGPDCQPLPDPGGR